MEVNQWRNTRVRYVGRNIQLHSQPLSLEVQMKEMRLFEVGFKDKLKRSGYYEKLYIGAADALTAAENARLYLMEKMHEWWANGGKEDMIFTEYAEDKEAEEDLSDGEILATKKYQEAATLIFAEQKAQIDNLHLARLQDVGELII